jgi:hypothetical protein
MVPSRTLRLLPCLPLFRVANLAADGSLTMMAGGTGFEGLVIL